MLNYEIVSSVTKQYRNEFKKANIFDTDIMALNDHHYEIVETIEKKRNGKTYETKKKVISAEEFMNELTWINWFNARVYKGYSIVGYVIQKMTYVSPDKTESRTIHYDFKRNDSWHALISNPMAARIAAGYREKDCMENCKRAELSYDGGHELVTIYHTDNEHVCVWDNITNKFVG